MAIRSAVFFVVFALLLSFSAQAQEAVRPDDQVVFDLAAENWVTTQSARVVLNIEAAVTAENAGALRTTMSKVVASVAKADWRLTTFARSQDQTGMERWSAQYEARLSEAQLNGLADDAKKNSKAGMQITVDSIDFSPTLEERQATLSLTRAQIYKQADDQLALLNKTLPGRAYRIAMIDFTDGGASQLRANAFSKAVRPMLAMARSAANDESAAPMEKAEKVTLTARVIFAAAQSLPPTTK